MKSRLSILASGIVLVAAVTALLHAATLPAAAPVHRSIGQPDLLAYIADSTQKTATGSGVATVPAAAPVHKNIGQPDLLAYIADYTQDIANSTGGVIRKTGAGQVVAYRPTADTDAGRGTALLSAIAAAESGDTLEIGAGGYDVGAAEVSLTGVTVRGFGAVITVTASDDPNFTLSGCTLYGVTIQETASNSGSTLITLAGDCEFRDCTLYGRTDIFNGEWTNTPTLKMWNCSLGGKFDIFSVSAVPAGSVVWLYNCRIEVDSTGHTDFTIANCLRPIAGTFHILGGYYRAVNSTSNASQNKAINAGGTAVVNVYGATVSVTSGGSDLVQTNSGVLTVVGGTGSGTNGAYVTSGTITRAGDFRAASATATGIVELATDAETVTGTDTVRAVTPANVTARLAAPGAIGGTTAAAGTFTTLASSGRFTNSVNNASAAPPVAITGNWLSGAGSSNTKPQLLVEATGTTSNGWTTNGTGIGVNAPSGFSGRLFDLQVNAASQASFTSAGDFVGNGAMSAAGGIVSRYSTVTPAGGSSQAFSMGTVGIGVSWGSGAPSTSRVQGSQYFRTDGNGLTRGYLNTNGSTGWAPIETTEQQTTTLAAAATSLAITARSVLLTGDAGGNTLATITGGVTGQILVIEFTDSLVTITDTAANTTDTVNLSAAWTGSADDTLTLRFNGTKWKEVGRSVN